MERHIKLFDQVEKTLDKEAGRLYTAPDDYKTSSRDVQKVGDKTVVTNRTIVKHKLRDGKGISIVEEKQVTMDKNKVKSDAVHL